MAPRTEHAISYINEIKALRASIKDLKLDPLYAKRDKVDLQGKILIDLLRKKKLESPAGLFWLTRTLPWLVRRKKDLIILVDRQNFNRHFGQVRKQKKRETIAQRKGTIEYFQKSERKAFDKYEQKKYDLHQLEEEINKIRNKYNLLKIWEKYMRAEMAYKTSSDVIVRWGPRLTLLAIGFLWIFWLYQVVFKVWLVFIVTVCSAPIISMLFLGGDWLLRWFWDFRYKEAAWKFRGELSEEEIRDILNKLERLKEQIEKYRT